MDERTMRGVKVETLEQIAEKLGWTPEQLAEAERRAAECTPLNLTERDYARAEAISKAMKQLRRDLDAVDEAE